MSRTPLIISGPDLVPSGIAANSMGSQAPNPLMEQAQTTLGAGFNTNVAQTRNNKPGDPRAIGHYSGVEQELCIMQLDPCFVQRGVYDATGTSARVGVFSGWNGMKLTGITSELDYYRAFTYVGISLGAAYIRARMDPNSQMGVTTAMTGTWTIPKHYGKKTIYVGDVIQMRLPPLDPAQLKKEMDERQSGDDFPHKTKIMATPEPVDPTAVMDFWRRSARDLIDKNFLTNGQPNPSFDLRNNQFSLGTSYTNRLSAQDTLTVQLKQFALFCGTTFAMHLIDHGVVTPVTEKLPPNSSNRRIGSSQLARQRLVNELVKVPLSNPHSINIEENGGVLQATKLDAVSANQQRELRDEFKRALLGVYGLVREDGGATEVQKLTRNYYMRVFGPASGDARYATIASQITDTTLLAPPSSISLMSQYSANGTSAAEQYRAVQEIAFESFMRKSGEVFDFLYKNCAGRAMSLTPEGSVLHGVR